MEKEKSRRLSRREIVELLLKYSELSLPQIAKLLDAGVGSVDYHLKKLAEKGIVNVKKRKYGTRYSLNQDIISASLKAYIQLASTLVFTITGIIFLFSFNFVLSAISFSVSSITGMWLAVEKIRYELKGKVERILEELG